MNKGDKLKVSVIRQELVELTGDFRRAVILNQFIYWSSRVRDHDLFLKEEQERSVNADVAFRNGWIYKKAEEMSDETMLNLSPSSMRRHMKFLVDNDWLQERRNPKYKWDRTLQYRVNTLKIKQDLYDLGYNADFEGGEYRVSIIEPPFSILKNGDQQNEKAIPETTPEITSENITPLQRVAETSPTYDLTNDIYGLKIKEVIRYYSDAYLATKGKKHPRLKREQVDKIVFLINQKIRERDLEVSDFEDIIDRFFRETKSDGNLNYFVKELPKYLSGY